VSQQGMMCEKMSFLCSKNRALSKSSKNDFFLKFSFVNRIKRVRISTDVTVLQDIQFLALKVREYFLEISMILNTFKPKNYHFSHF